MAIVIKEIVVKATVVGERKAAVEIPEDWARRLREEVRREVERRLLPEGDKPGGRLWKR